MPAPHHSVFFTGQMPFLPPNQQHQRQLQDLEMLVQKLLSYKMPFMTSQKKKEIETHLYTNCQVTAAW